MIILISIMCYVLYPVNCQQNNNPIKTLCNDKYCLYSDGNQMWYTSIESAKSVCTQMNGNRWLLEVYDADVKRLVDQFVSQYQLIGRYIPLNTRLSTQGWTWIDNTSCRF